MTLLAWTAALRRATQQWDDQCEQLDGARTTLGQAEPALLGGRVSGAAEAFVTTWSAEIRRLHADAGAHASALRATARDLDLSDGQAVEDMRQLMAWNDRAVAPVGGDS